MSTPFTNILIPVDFSENTDIAVRKAVEFADSVNTVIHLFHVANPPFQINRYHMYVYGNFVNTPLLNDWYSGEIEMKMQPYKQFIQESLPFTAVNIHMTTGGSIQQSIIELVNELKVELIIIGKKKCHTWCSFFNTIDPSFLAKKTNSAVLTVKPGAANATVRSIVLPVRSFVPARKIKLLSAVTRKNKPTIHLVTTCKKESSKTNVFVDTYRTISEYMHYPIEYKVLEGHNFARAIFNYAEQIKADMVLVNPYEETRVNSVSGTDICDLISPSSKLTVLTAEPFFN